MRGRRGRIAVRLAALASLAALAWLALPSIAWSTALTPGQHGVEVGRHSRPARRSLPTPERMKYEFRRFRQLCPWVTTFAIWNEANHCGEPTCHRPKLVAAYYRALRRECPSCTIVAPELLDMPNIVEWMRAFNHGLGHVPQLWALHNYVEANRFTMRRLRRLQKLAPRSGLWLTETGGLVRRDNASTTDIPRARGMPPT